MRHNELRDLEAELLNIVCSNVQVEPVLQDISGEQLNEGSNRAPDARLDIRAREFWESQRSAFFDVRVCHPNAGFVQGPGATPSLQDTRKREEAPLCKESPRNRARNIYATRIHHHRRYGQRMCEIP